MTLGYTPENHGTGIVHFGTGAFHRAHQAVYTDDALALSGGDWRILGVSLRSATVGCALNAQDGRYTLVIRGHDAPSYRTIGSVTGVLTPAPDQIDRILEALARPQTRIVSLTITEKAYGLDHPDGAIGLIARGLQLRRDAGLPPFTVMSCDNLPDNGKLTRAAVLACSASLDPDLADWIDRNGAFPSTMVDRITPACTQALIADVAQATGQRDLAPVEAERFIQWVIEDDFCNGRPDWHKVGAVMVRDVSPYEHMKLRMLNGAHSLLAYAGFLSGHRYVRDVMACPALAGLVAHHIQAAAATLDPLEGINLDQYGADLVQRFANPNIGHETYQIAMDGSQKMPQRLFDPALVAIARGTDWHSFAFAVAAWLRYVKGHQGDGTRYELRDPRAAELAALWTSGNALSNLAALPNLMPAALAQNAAFLAAVEGYLDVMVAQGMDAAVRRFST